MTRSVEVLLTVPKVATLLHRVAKRTFEWINVCAFREFETNHFRTAITCFAVYVFRAHAWNTTPGFAIIAIAVFILAFATLQTLSSIASALETTRIRAELACSVRISILWRNDVVWTLFFASFGYFRIVAGKAFDDTVCLAIIFLTPFSINNSYGRSSGWPVALFSFVGNDSCSSDSECFIAFPFWSGSRSRNQLSVNVNAFQNTRR